MKKDSDLHIRIERDLGDKFIRYSEETGGPRAVYIRAYILALVSGQVKNPTVVQKIKEG